MKRNIVTIHLMAVLIVSQLPFVTLAQTNTNALNSPRANVDVTSQDFKFVSCDGPDLSKLPKGSSVTVTVNGKRVVATGGGSNPPGYVVCDFNGMIKTVQHLIDIAMVIGVFAAFGSFCFIGYLFMTGAQDNIKKAKSIFPKIFFGFIIMLAAWFIVYQLLGWLGASAGFKALLGSA